MHLTRIRRPYVALVALALALGALAFGRPQTADAQLCTYCTAPADLRVTNIYATRNWSYPGSYYLWVTVRNDGATAAQNFRFAYGVSNSTHPSQTFTMSSLKAGQEMTFALLLSWRPAGGATSHQLWAHIDAADFVYESNEGNNYMSVWFNR
jgi:subtilase family serine protease